MSEQLHVWVYILLCADGSYYTGCTKKDPESRTWEHNEGFVPSYTRNRRPVKLVYSEYFDRLIDGFEREQQIKRWSRAKKEALIEDDREGLSLLARPRNQAKQ